MPPAPLPTTVRARALAGPSVYSTMTPCPSLARSPPPPYRRACLVLMPCLADSDHVEVVGFTPSIPEVPAMRILLLGWFMMLNASCASGPRAVPDPASQQTDEAVRAQIEAVNARWVRAFTEGGAAEAVPFVFAEDAVRIPAGREAVTGRATIQERARQNPRFRTADVELLEFERSGDLAFTREAYTLTTDAGETYTGRSLVIWKRQPDDTWKVYRIMFD